MTTAVKSRPQITHRRRVILPASKAVVSAVVMACALFTFRPTATFSDQPRAVAVRGGLQVLSVAGRDGGIGPADDLAESREPHGAGLARDDVMEDRKSTRLNSSHSQISYAVFCL